MAHLPKLGQFGHTFTRSNVKVVQSVEERWHRPGKRTLNLWKYITLCVGAPSVVITMINVYLLPGRHVDRPEPIHYPYLKTMNKPFPWGDGKHSLFHNKKHNWIPGIGYEE